jgi:hypothetical protein
MFKAVSELNVAFGNEKGDPLNPAWSRLTNQAKNIQDEYEELMEALANKDMTEVRDAICDILVFTLGLGHMAGINVEADMKAVDLSNRSKFCSNDQELAATVKKYVGLGVAVYCEGEYPMMRVKSERAQIGNDGKTYQADKMLKSVTFKEPVFAKIMPPMNDPYDELMDPIYQ